LERVVRRSRRYFSRAGEIARGRSAFLDAWLASKPHLRARFGGATREGEAAATGPFAAQARRAWHPGALLVGDAADFFDPFTGEGIYSALRGGELAADATLQALAVSHPIAPLREYERARRREFAGKWRVERIIGSCVAWPAVVNRAVAALGARQDLADLLVGVTGDFVPAAAVLRLGYLARLFLLPLPRSTPMAWL
jgi:menaquinone-9 beta-reductase